MSLLKKTRLQLLANQNANGSPALDNLADVAAHFNQQKQTNDTLTESVLQLNAEAAANEIQIITNRIPDFLSTGVVTILSAITLSGAPGNAAGNVYKGVVALDLTNTLGVGADVVAVSIVAGDSVSSAPLITSPLFTLGAGVTLILRMGVEIIRNTTTTLHVKWISGTSDLAPITLSAAPSPATPITVPEGDLTFGLFVDLDAGVGVIGTSFFEMGCFPGTVV